LPKILASPCWHGRGPVFAKDLAPFGPTSNGESFFFFGNQLHLLVFWLGWWNFLFLLSPFMFAKRNFGSLIFLCTAGVKRIPLAQQNNQMNEIKKVRNKRWQQIL